MYVSFVNILMIQLVFEYPRPGLAPAPSP